MARISQYKALGTKMGGYKATLSKVQSMEYAKKHADWKAGEQKALYGEIGKTVSNIIGIAQERKRLKDLEPLPTPDRPEVKLDQQSPEALEDLGGVRSESEIDFGMGSDAVGKIDSEAMQIRGPAFDKLGIDIPPKPTPMDFTGAKVGRGATDSMRLSPDTTAGALPMTGLPFAENNMRGFTGGQTQDTQTGYPIWSEDSVGAGDATYPTKEEVAGIHPVQKRGALTSLGNVPSYFATEAETQAFQNEINQNIQSNLPVEKTDYPTEAELSLVHPAPGRGYDPDRVGNQPNVQPGTPDSPRPDWMKERLDTPPEGARPNPTMERETASMITDDFVIDALNPEEPSLMGSARDYNIEKAIGAVSGDKDSVKRAFAMESSSGMDPKAKGNPFQIKSDSARAEFESKYGKNYSIENSAKFYEEVTKKNVGAVKGREGSSFENYKFKTGRLSRQYPGGANIFEGASEAIGGGKDVQGFVEYMTWQQGRTGALDIITTTMGEGGKLNKTSKAYMLNNISESQKLELKDLSDKEFAQKWLRIQHEKWESK